MANLNYKPLFSGGRVEDNIIFTTSIDKPTIGTVGKLYIFTDKDQKYWWDPRSQTYKLLGVIGGTESKIGGSVDNFPYPGQKGIIYIDGQGKKYVWDENQGIKWIQTSNLRLFTPEQAAMVPDNIPYILQPAQAYFLPLVRTNKNGESVLAEFIIHHCLKGYYPALDPNTLKFPGGIIGQPFYLNLPCTSTGSSCRPNYYYANDINNGVNTVSYRAITGSYIPIS